jgi:RNA polymerase sigma factor (sigma-70 family)
MGKGRRSTVLGPIDRLFRAGTASGLSDGQLLERFASRHDEAAEAAFAALVERHGPMVLGVCRRVLDNPHDAQDAFQATFLVLVRKARAVRKQDSVASWLYGVASRVSAHSRAAAARRRDVERHAGEAAAMAHAYESAHPDRDLWDEVDRLPQTLRAAVVLFYLEGLTHDQAASRLGWPVGTVRSRLARARERLRSRLTRRGLAPGAQFLPVLSFKPSMLPLDLLESTVKAAMLVAARDAAEAGLVSISAAALTEGVLRTMLVSKLKSILVLSLTAGAVAAGTGVFAYQDSAPAPEQAARDPAPAAKKRVTDLDEARDRMLAAFVTRMMDLTQVARLQQVKGDHEGEVATTRAMERLCQEWRSMLGEPGAVRLRHGQDVLPPPQPGAPNQTVPSSLRTTPPLPPPDIQAGPPRAEPSLPKVYGLPSNMPRLETDSAPILAPSALPPEPAPAASPRAGQSLTRRAQQADSDRRLQELERKVERILRLLEKAPESNDPFPRSNPNAN